MRPVLLAFCDFWYDLISWLLNPIDLAMGNVFTAGYKRFWWLLYYAYQFLWLILGGNIALSILRQLRVDLEQS